MKINKDIKKNTRKSLIEKRLKYLEENDCDASYFDITMGCMFSSKTSHLLSVIESAGRVDSVLYINHLSDSRTSSAISTHSLSKDITKVVSDMNGEAVKLERLKDYPLERLINQNGTLKFSTICIDEAQFFKDLKKTVTFFVDILSVPFIYITGLDGTSTRKNFGDIHKLIPLADSYTKLKNAQCEICAQSKKHKHALFTHKFAGDLKNVIEIGNSNKYMPVCRKCFNKLNNFHKF